MGLSLIKERRLPGTAEPNWAQATSASEQDWELTCLT
jgi:hypothetical protein